MTFSNPPIVEAIFHLVVERDGEFDHETLNNYVTSITEEFPNKQENRLLGGNISFDPSNTDSMTSSINNILQGYTISSSDGSSIIQANSNSFSFSKLNSYETWEAFYGKANQFWLKYLEITSANRVNRLSLRYLNRIKIPFDGVSCTLEDYIKLSPTFSNESNDLAMSGYFMQISLLSKIYQSSKAIVNQTVGLPEIDNNTSSQYLPLIFDIEVFQDTNIDSRSSIIESIFSNDLRRFKNYIFFDNITDKTKELFI
jgi:uncharacterized protein (TIGR04255 family)